MINPPGRDFSTAVGEFTPELRVGLGLLLESFQYVQDLGCNVWDFAVEIHELRAIGLSGSAFRWLACKGYIQHALEVTAPGHDIRSFQPGGKLSFSAASCFVLTACGAEVARAVLDQPGHATAEPACSNGHAQPAHALELPTWNRDCQELRLGKVLVKQFKVPAPNQEIVLATFQEEGWPARIDDPLPGHPTIDAKRRLNETIASLNRHQKQRLLHFRGDGSGQGVRWEHALLEEQAPFSAGRHSKNGDQP